MLLALDRIRIDGDTQPRASIDLAIVAEYAEDIQNGATLPPVVVFHDGAAYWLADGFHRWHAARSIGADVIAADVRIGTVEDARWYSYSANQSHGMRRSNEDKRRAVLAALQHPKAALLSSREIARHCGVSHQTVENYRIGICQNLTDTRLVTRNGVTFEMNTANVGRREEAPSGELFPSPAPAIPFVPTAADYADPYGDEEDGSRRPANFSSASNEWYTPAQYIDAARAVMGSIDLDPASNCFAQKTVKAIAWMGPQHWEYRDGLAFEWSGNVWLNPPYGVVDGESQSGIWARKLISEYDEGRVTQAVLLVNAVTDRVWFRQLWRFPICFTDHRIRFETPDGTPQQPVTGNAFVYLGDRVDVFVRVFSQFGTVVRRMEVDNAKS